MDISSAQLLSIFADALECPDGNERQAFVARACGGDARLRSRVEALLAAHAQAGTFLEPQSPANVAVTAAGDGSPTPGDLSGSTIGPYKLLEQVGEGGMGIVYMADQLAPVRRRVALKVIKPGMDSRQVIARFEAERQALALMDHPNIASVLDAGATSAGSPYFVMELVRGVPITEYCDHNQLGVAERLALFIQVCHAVQHAHQKGIIHRDIKPSNVLVTLHDGRPVPKVIDFGIAKATNQQLTDKTLFTNFAQMIGTPLYMSPEQAEMSGLDIDTRSDVYSLGVLLYELLTGVTPFDRGRFQQAAYDELRRIIREEEPPLPSTRISTLGQASSASAAARQMTAGRLRQLLEGDLDWIVMKTLQKDRTARYESTSALARDVERYLANEPIEARPPSAAYRLRKFAQRRKRLLATLGAFALLLVVATIVSSVLAIRAIQAERLAAARLAEVSAERDAKEQARQDAVVNEQRAEQAALAERDAREQAQRRLDQVARTNNILASIFDELNPTVESAGGRPLRVSLAEHLDRAANQLDAEAVGDARSAAFLQNRLALALLGLGYPDKAIPLITQVRETATREFGPEDPHTLQAMHELATAYHLAGRYEDSLKLFQEALALREKVLGPTHPQTLVTMAALAKRAQDAGDHERAIALFESVLAAQSKDVAATDPMRLLNAANLAESYRSLGRMDRALPLFIESLEGLEKTFGKGHPNLLRVLTGLATTYTANGEWDKAQPLFEESLQVARTNLPPDHQHTLAIMNNLAAGYHAVQRLDRSIPLFEEVVARHSARFGPGHRNTIQLQMNLGMNYSDAGRLNEAIAVLRGAYDQARETTHFDLVASTGRALGVAYEKADRASDAEALYGSLIEIARRQFGEEHPQYAAALVDFADYLIHHERPLEAEEPLRGALAILEAKSPDELTTFNVKSMLGDVLLQKQSLAEAEPLLLSGYEGLAARQARDRANAQIYLKAAIERLAHFYDAAGKPEQAAEWRAKLQPPAASE